MNKDHMAEILGAFVKAEENPSGELFKALAGASKMSVLQVENMYREIYQDRTGSDDDPLGPLPFFKG